MDKRLTGGGRVAVLGGSRCVDSYSKGQAAILKVKKIIFVTGTDTGAGKTVLTALLLAFLREKGCNALAMKPFCSGSQADAELLYSLQNAEEFNGRAGLPTAALDEINPFYYPEPVAPAASSALQVSLKVAVQKIRALSDRCDLLLVEGSGGLMVPLGPKFLIRDLIASLKCDVFVACPNRLGVINHTLLTVESLQNVGTKNFRVVMMETRHSDESSAKNAEIIAKMSPKTPIFRLPYLGLRASTTRGIQKSAKKMKKTLAALVGAGYLDLVL